MEERIVIACASCGSPNVAREAWAAWSVEAQRWELAELFDYAFCHQCHRRVTLVPRPSDERG